MLRSATIAVALAGLTLAGCQSMGDSPESDGFAKMSSLRMKSTLVGNTFTGSDSGGKYSIFYPERGKFRATYNGQADTGVWEARDGLYCRKWDNLGSGKERCVAIYTRGDEMIWTVPNGKQTDQGVLRKGNPENL